MSLFTGAGGLDLGFEAAGYITKVAVEFDPAAVDTLKANRPEWAIVADNIHSAHARSERLLELGGWREGDIDVLVGGPPCQPFSKSGYWKTGDAKRLADPRAGTLGAYLRVLRDLKPKVFLLENVPGLAFSKKDEGIRFLESTVESINKESGLHYSFTPAVLEATDYGVPQARKRVFIVGHREGAHFAFPAPTHSSRGATMALEARLPCPTAWDAIGHIDEAGDDPELRVTGKWANLLPTIPEGCNYLHHTDRGAGFPLFGWRTRYWSFLMKLAKSLPSWTIAAQPGPAIGPFHWDNRRLSRRELARLQTFPADYSIQGSLRAAQRQIGNAVPAAVAEILAAAIMRQFFGGSPDRSPTLVPIAAGKYPPPKPHIEELPVEYAHLIGVHKAHPGTGFGPGARSREAITP